jgi:hypothetical protein
MDGLKRLVPRGVHDHSLRGKTGRKESRESRHALSRPKVASPNQWRRRGAVLQGSKLFDIVIRRFSRLRRLLHRCSRSLQSTDSAVFYRSRPNQLSCACDRLTETQQSLFHRRPPREDASCKRLEKPEKPTGPWVRAKQEKKERGKFSFDRRQKFKFFLWEPSKILSHLVYDLLNPAILEFNSGE